MGETTNTNVKDKKTTKRNSIWNYLFAVYSLVLLSVAVFFSFFYHSQDTITYLGKQFEFLGTVASFILLWFGTALFLLIFNRGVLVRFLGFSVVFVLGFISLFRFSEMDGDMIPRFSLRWSPEKQNFSAETETNIEGAYGSFPQFQGPSRDGRLSDIPELKLNWDEDPPTILWSKPVGEGFSGFVIDGQMGYSICQNLEDPEKEEVFCLNIQTSEKIWSHLFESRFDSSLGGIGPRATPIIDGDYVYFLGGNGIFSCFTKKEGSLIWAKDFVKDFGATIPEWGYAGAPLIFKDHIIVAPGATGQSASLVAFEKKSGDLVWKAGERPVSWSSPTIAEIHGKSLLVHLNAETVEVRDPNQSGILVSEFKWGRKFPQVSIPIVVGKDKIFVSSGYGIGSALYRIPEILNDLPVTAEKVWSKKRMKSKFANLFNLDDQNILGLNDGTLTIIDATNGERLFEGERYGHGQILSVSNDQYLIQSEKGSLIMVSLDNGEIIEQAKFEVFKNKTWNPPAMVGPHVMMRNHRQMALVRLPTK